MNTWRWTRGFLRFALLASLTAGLVVAGSLVRAEVTVGVPILTVTPLRAEGGSIQRGPDGRMLNIRLTEAFRQYLVETAEGRFWVAGERGRTPQSRMRLTLTGELSHVATETPGGGSYLCVLRLYREGRRKQLLGHWAGTARTLRDLTGNLRRHPEVDPQGLVGELGKRVRAAVVSLSGIAQAEMLEEVARRYEAASSLSVTALPEKSAPDAGARYRLQVTSREAGSLYLIDLGRSGLSAPALVSERGLDVPAGTAVALPDGEPLAVEKVSEPIIKDFVVLLRRTERVKRPIEVGAKFTRPIEMGARYQPPGPTAPVQVVGDVWHAGNAVQADPKVASLIDAIHADPPGTWLSRRVTLRISPALAVWEQYTTHPEDSQKVQVRLQPDKVMVRVGEPLRILSRAMERGYLVVIERGVSGSINLLYPLSRKVEDAQVSPGQVVTFPSGDQVFEPDAPGKEQIKAILFSSREEARALIAGLPAVGVRYELIPSESKPTKASDESKRYYVADFTFEVVGSGPGAE